MKLKKEEFVTLVLNVQEARWLKRIMQNPLNEEKDINLEEPIDSNMRKMFWDILSQHGL